MHPIDMEPVGVLCGPSTVAWEAVGLEHDWTALEKTNIRSICPQRRLNLNLVRRRADKGALRPSPRAVFCIHQRILTELFFFHRCRSLAWEEKMAVSFVACMGCVWFPWFVFLLWKRNRAWLWDGKQTTVCQRGHSSCPPEGAVNSCSLELCQRLDHPPCRAQKATRQRGHEALLPSWPEASASSHPPLGMQAWNKPVWWTLDPAVQVCCGVNLKWAQGKRAKRPRVNRASQIPFRAEPGRKSLYCSVKSHLAMFKLNSFVFYCSAES